MKNKDLLFLLTLLSAFAEADGANMYARNIRSMNFVPKTHTQTMISNYLSQLNDTATVVPGDSIVPGDTIVQGSPDVWNFSDYESIGNYELYVDRTYKVACIRSYNDFSAPEEIPSHFSLSDGEYAVVCIGDGNSVFYSDGFSSIKLPETLRIIGDNAFSGCYNLGRIEIPQSVVRIGDNAFNYCRNLEKIEIPQNVVRIGNECFYNCHSLTSVIIPVNSKLSEIGYRAFYETNLTELELPESVQTLGHDFLGLYSGSSKCQLKINAMTPPVLASSLSCIALVRVPQGAGEAYRGADIWSNYPIIEGDGLTLNIHVDVPGTLGKKILAETENMSDVNGLILSGTLNDDDAYNTQQRLTNLLFIDLSAVNMKHLTPSMFENRSLLEKIILPENLESIGYSALYGCESLDSIQLPESLRKIDSHAFCGCRKLTEIQIPEGVDSLGESTFRSCSNLETLRLPSTLKVVPEYMAAQCGKLKNLILPEGIEVIENNAFEYCSRLRNIELPNTLVKLGSSAFGDCDSLVQIVLPEGLSSCARAFESCQNLKEVTCMALFPPYLGSNYSLFGYDDQMREGAKLLVPKMALTDYKLTQGWDIFPVIEGVDYMPKNINVPGTSEWELPNSFATDYKPDLSLIQIESSKDYIETAGKLTVKGTAVLSLGKYSMVYNPYEYNRYSSEDILGYNALINEANMRADSVQITLYNTSNRWHFLSFPYDVKVSDIMPLYENTNWVIRKYSGASRAAQDMEKTWQNMTADSVLQAGVGYIWQSTCSKNSCGFVVPALNNTQKNLIFSIFTRSIALEEHLSEFAHNRSWNLIGNPFPSFYDIRFIDFTAPITVWNDNNSTYEAYSPLDDEYILRPGEAFFVQRPVDKATIEFAPEGRQTTRLVREMPQSIVARAQGRGLQVERQVFNIELSNGEITDRTRFVLNEDASRDYDLATDAGKFMSPDASVSQLYTIENGVSLSINERPLDDGMIALGAYFGRKGSYTLSLNTRADAQVYLIDNLTGAETDLNMQDYTFNAEAGTVNDRFVIVVKKEETTTGLSNNMSVAKVTAVSGQILVQAPQSADIAVYATDGKIVGKSQGTEASFSVRPGVYVVIINGTSYKVTVTE